MTISSFRDRKLNPDKKVRVYRNLAHQGIVWSIKQDGLVIGHTSSLALIEPKLIVSTSGKKRALREQQRNVHAYIEGFVSDVEVGNKNMRRIAYYPFTESGFVYCDDNSNIETISLVSFTDTGVYVN